MKKSLAALLFGSILLNNSTYALNLFGRSEEKKQQVQPSKAIEHKNLLEYEKNTISVFENTVKSVVNVANNRIIRRFGFFDFDSMEVPAGIGSGFIWDNKGHIVTNYHVIAEGDSHLVSFHKDPKQYKAKLVGVAPNKDIAVLKLEEMPENLIPIRIGTSKGLRVGQKAMALGNPFGLDHTITAGIISALDRKIQGIGRIKIQGMIQTDSSINPGNSGGPLINSSGEVIGMNTMIYSASGSSAGVGFAVPADTIKRIVPQLIKHGKVIRPVLGIIPLPDRYKTYFEIDEGVVIKYADPHGPVGRVGLKGIGKDHFGRYYIGDVILKVDDHEVKTVDDIFHVLEKYKVGDEVTVTYLRKKKKRTVKVKLKKL
jgi:S1-C subfamily serine protease